MGFKAGNINGTISLNSSTSGTTSIGTGTNSGTISIGNTNSGAVSIDCGTAGITVGTTANAHSSTFGSTNSTSTTTVQSGSGGITLTGVVTSANAITVTSGAITASSGDVVITSGNLQLPNTTSTPTGVIQFGSTDLRIHNYGTHNNTFIGKSSGNMTLTSGTATDNTCCGFNTGNQLTTGATNCALGANSLSQLSSGSSNCTIGQQSMLSLQTGSANCGLGQNALVFITSGSNNTAIGVTGTATGAGQNYNGAESSNIVINNAGVNGESNVIRIGTAGSGAGQQNKCFVAGIFGVTVGGSGVPVVVDNAGQLGTVVSSIVFKENVKDMGIESEPVLDLRPVTFNYKNDEFKSKRYGLIAEEVAKTFPGLAVYDEDGNPATVKYQDLPVLLLNEIKKLKERIISLEAKQD